jgi:hypothetical protein
MNKITKFLGLILMLGVLAFVGTCSWQLYQGNKTNDSPAPPSIEKAEYSLRIKNTGVTVYSDKVMNTPIDTPPGATWVTRQLYLYTLPDGYWEVKGDKFVFRKVALTLDERIFGEIEMAKR